MNNAVSSLFNVEKAVIGMVHFLPLPGAPLYDKSGGMKKIIAAAQADQDALVAAGVDGILYCNEGDMPYLTEISRETVAAAAAAVQEVSRGLDLPFGVNMLLDPTASLAVAAVTGGSFVRGSFSGVYAGDMGFWNTFGGQALRLRANVGADHVKIFANINAGFSVPIADRALSEVTKGAIFTLMADGLCVSGTAAAVPPKLADLKEVREAAGSVSVIASSGVSLANLDELFPHVDGVVIGSSLKVDGATLNPIDPKRAEAFMQKFNQLRGQ